MTVSFAPMEGVTHHVYRSAHAACFSPADRYFIPFASPRNRSLSHREKQDLLPENNRGLYAVPQLLTNDAGDFLWAAGELKAMGYQEVNLNLGCPSATVVSKKKGAGLLESPERLNAFLCEIFAHCPISISIKTRLGMRDPAEFDALLEIYNRYPVTELIIHPRVREDQYRGPVRPEGFEKAMRESAAPLCYNGDLFTAERLRAFQTACPGIQNVMIGRGLVMRPGLLGAYRGQGGEQPETLRRFHELLYTGYQAQLQSETFTLMKMKEVWAYLGAGQGLGDKAMKRLRKANRYRDYEEAVEAAFLEMEQRAEGGLSPAGQ